VTTPTVELELQLLREVASTLNRDLPPEDNLRSAVAAIRHAAGAARVTLWRRAPGGADGPPVSDPEAPRAPGDGLRADLVHAGHRLGALEVVPGPGGTAAEDGWLRGVADLLALYLDGLLLSEDLASEVAARARELQVQRRFTGLVIDSLPVGLYVVDRDYRIQVWNRKRETGTQGIQREQAVGRLVFDVLSRQPAPELKAEFDRVFEAGETVHWEQEVDVGGEPRHFRLSKIPMRLAGDAVSHVITIGEDVTERRVTEQRILQSEKLAAVGQLAAGVMHEINNPLATIGACVAAIESRVAEVADDTVREYLAIIEAEVQRCTRIVDQLLDFSRPRRNRPAPAPADLNALVEQTLFLLKHHQRFKRLTVERDLGADLPPVLADGERVVQAFMAIMLNAADAMERGGTLRVRTRRSRQHPDEVVAELEDTGIGIPPSELDKIFEPFYTTKGPGRGTGLGLTIAYSLIEEQRGRITVQSAPGQGTTFRIFLPVAPEVAA
jgi:two-component system NtrC family sensor kinase